MSNLEATDGSMLNSGPLSSNTQEAREVSRLVEEFQAFAVKNSPNGVDLNSLSDEKFGRVMDAVKENETNSLEYHKKKLDVIKEIELGKIKASTSSNTTRMTIIICVLSALVIISVIILIFKEQYTLNWLSFIGGLFGGAGLTKAIAPGKDIPEKETITKED